MRDLTQIISLFLRILQFFSSYDKKNPSSERATITFVIRYETRVLFSRTNSHAIGKYKRYYLKKKCRDSFIDGNIFII